MFGGARKKTFAQKSGGQLGRVSVRVRTGPAPYSSKVLIITQNWDIQSGHYPDNNDGIYLEVHRQKATLVWSNGILQQTTPHYLHFPLPKMMMTDGLSTLRSFKIMVLHLINNYLNCCFHVETTQ